MCVSIDTLGGCPLMILSGVANMYFISALVLWCEPRGSTRPSQCAQPYVHLKRRAEALSIHVAILFVLVETRVTSFRLLETALQGEMERNRVKWASYGHSSEAQPMLSNV